MTNLMSTTEYISILFTELKVRGRRTHFDVVKSYSVVFPSTKQYVLA